MTENKSSAANPDNISHRKSKKSHAFLFIAALAVVLIIAADIPIYMHGSTEKSNNTDSRQTSEKSVETPKSVPISELNLSRSIVSVELGIKSFETDIPDIINKNTGNFGGCSYHFAPAESISIELKTNADATEIPIAESFDNSIAEVYDLKKTSDGEYAFKVTGKKIGETDIIFRSEDKSLSTVLHVSVTKKDLKIVSDNSDILSFSEDGKYSIESSGNTVIRWLYGDDEVYNKEVEIIN